MADQTRQTASGAPPPPEPTYELEWEPRATRQPKRGGRLSRLFPMGGSATPQEDPEAMAAAPPPPPRRPSSFQRKPLPAATPPPPPAPAGGAAVAGTSDDELGKGPHSQHHDQPPVAAHGQTTPATVGGAAEKPPPPPLGRRHDAVAAPHSGARARLDAALPPGRRYLGMRRRVFLVVVAAAAALLLLALVVGLAVGLSRRSGGSQEGLPLPGRDGGGTHEGELTFYDPGLGACGSSHGGGEMVAAVARSVFDAAANRGDGNPNNNPICGKRIRIEREGGSVEVTVVDRCEGCKPTDLDLSPSAFQRLAREEDGRVVGQWKWL